MRKTITLATLLGIVLVGTIGLGQRPSGTPRRAEPTPSTAAPEKVYSYSIKLTSTGEYTDSTDKENFKLTGNWERMVVRVSDQEGVLVETPEKAVGKLEGVWHYEYSSSAQKCVGDSPFSGKPTAEIVGWQSRSDESNSHVRFLGVDDDLRRPAHTCEPHGFPNLWTRGTQKKLMPDGLEVEQIGQHGAGFLRRGGSGLFFPLDRLRDGKGFTVKAGDTVGNSDYSYTWSLELVFTPGQVSPPPPTDPEPRQGCAAYDKRRCEDLRKATWDYSDVLKNLTRLPAGEVTRRVKEIIKLLEEPEPRCAILPHAEELDEIRRSLEAWMNNHRNVQPRLGRSRTEGTEIRDRLRSLTDKVCKRCCGGIGPSPPGLIESRQASMK